MISLGIRVSGLNIFLCILNNDSSYVFEKIILPKVFSLPEKLKYLRFNLIDILNEYKITRVSIKIIEFNSKNFDITRCFIEGVIQETLASSPIDSYCISNFQKTIKKLKLNNDVLKNLIANNESFLNYAKLNGFEVDNKTTKEKREAFLLALSNIKEIE